MADYFYNAIKRDITMIQNDTMSFAFQIQGLEGQSPDNIVFTCKETPESNEILFTVSLGDHISLRIYDEINDVFTYVLRIPPELTEEIELGRYFYDLQIIVNADILTLLKGRLTLEYQVTGESVEPEPPLEYGDSVKYPLNAIPLGTLKIYTEQYISDIAAHIQAILGTEDTYNTQEMSGALISINDIILDLSEKLKLALSDDTPDNITLPDMPGAMDTINDDLSDISDAINTITGGSGSVPISDMAALIQASGYNEKVTIIFPSSMLDETWTCEATGEGADTERYTGTVDNTFTTIVTLKQATTEYTISCGGVEAVYTTGGVSSFNLGSAALIIVSLLNLNMTSNNYTDGYNINYQTSASSTYRGEPFHVFNNDSAAYWILGTPRDNGYLQLKISTPCKIKKLSIRSDFNTYSITFLIQGSLDGVTWDTIKSVTTEATGARDATDTYDLDPLQSYSHYRLYFLDFSRASSDYLPRVTKITITKVTG